MTNVHGISVSGGSFPAQIWRRFMDPALAGLPAREFPEPAQPVVFQQWQRGSVVALVRPILRGSHEHADDDRGGDGDAPAAEGHAAEGSGDAGAGRRAVAGRRGHEDSGHGGASANGGRPAEP